MDNEQKKELWWRPAVIIFSNISGWIVGPVIISLILGKYLDKKYNSEPWFFLSLTGIAFLISIFGILKILTKYLKEIEKESKERAGQKENPEINK